MHAYRPDHHTFDEPRSPRLWFGQPPLLLAGAVASLMVIVAIVTNATVMQPGAHPSPLFETRAERQPARPVEETKVADARTQTTAPKKAVQKTAADEVLREVQSALAVRGYYAGKVDGLYGSRTRGAITAFQRDHSVTVDGKPSVRLLTRILMSASAQPAAVPIPKEQELARAATPEPKRAAAPAVRKEVPSGLVARIQSGLRAYGYDDLAVDGKMGQHTATAIQRFQLDYGMKITGEPSAKVLEKLQEIGALPASQG